MLVALGTYLVDRWLYDICLNVTSQLSSPARELAVELLCQAGAVLELLDQCVARPLIDLLGCLQ